MTWCQTKPNQTIHWKSFICLFVCACWNRLFWDSGITDLGSLQFPLSLMAVPTFLFGLYGYNHHTDVHPWSLAVSAIVSSCYILGFYFGYTKRVKDAAPVNPGISAFCVNLLLTILFEVLRRLLFGNGNNQTNKQVSKNITKHNNSDDTEYIPTESLLFPNRPIWDVPKLKRFGDHTLTPQLIWKSMQGINEPLTNPW